METLLFIFFMIIVILFPIYQLNFSKIARNTKELKQINNFYNRMNLYFEEQNSIKISNLKKEVEEFNTNFHSDKKKLLLDFINLSINKLNK